MDVMTTFNNCSSRRHYTCRNSEHHRVTRGWTDAQTFDIPAAVGEKVLLLKTEVKVFLNVKGLLPKTEVQAFLNVKDLRLDCQLDGAWGVLGEGYDCRCHESCASSVGARWEDHAVERHCCDDGMFEGPETQLYDVHCPEGVGDNGDQHHYDAAEGDVEEVMKGDSECAYLLAHVVEAHQQHTSYRVFDHGHVGHENLHENDCVSHLSQQYCVPVEKPVETYTDHHDHCGEVVAAGKEQKHCCIFVCCVVEDSVGIVIVKVPDGWQSHREHV
jgi:hypothetical protein